MVGLVVCTITLSSPTAAKSFHESTGQLTIDADLASRVVKTGNTINFQTRVTVPDGGTGPWIVAMNNVNLGDGDPVDPEDWSPLRAQAIERVDANRQAVLDWEVNAVINWEVNAIIKGDCLVYIVALASPASAGETSQPVSSQGIHLTVEQFLRINPGGVLPLAIGMPLALSGLLYAVTRARRRMIDGEVVV